MPEPKATIGSGRNRRVEPAPGDNLNLTGVDVDRVTAHCNSNNGAPVSVSMEWVEDHKQD